MSLTRREIRRIEARMTALPEPDMTDPDNPEWTEEMFARAKGPESLPPEVLAAFPRTVARLRGAQKKPVKRRLALRIDPDVLDHFKASGRGWQSRINQALRDAMERTGRG
jgi:uncharacterized protein (DUF4415 family)